MRIIVKDYRKPTKTQCDICSHVLLQIANEQQQIINTMLQAEINLTPITVTIKTATETVHVQLPEGQTPTRENILHAVTKALIITKLTTDAN